jgi:broad specificity phosphatase PhoE
MKLYLVRHAQRDFGINFDSLKPEGIKQAKQLGEHFRNRKFDVIYCSPQNRAKQTFQEIFKRLKSKPEVVISEDVRQQSAPGEVGKDVIKRLELKNENDKQTSRRAEKFFKKILKKHSQDVVLVVSHKMFIKNLLSNLLKEDFNVNSASITTLEFDRKGKLIKSKINKTLYKVKPKVLGGWQYNVRILPNSVIKTPKTKKEIRKEIQRFLEWKDKKEDPNIRVEKMILDRKESVIIIKNSKLPLKYFANPRFSKGGIIKQDKVKIVEESIKDLYKKGKIRELKILLKEILKFVNFLWENSISEKTGKFYSCLGRNKSQMVLADFGEITNKREKVEKQLEKKWWGNTTEWLEKNCDKNIANFFNKNVEKMLSLAVLGKKWGTKDKFFRKI